MGQIMEIHFSLQAIHKHLTSGIHYSWDFFHSLNHVVLFFVPESVFKFKQADKKVWQMNNIQRISDLDFYMNSHSVLYL